MIGKLSGIVDTIASDRLVLDVGGVGYIVYGTTSMLTSLPQAGEPVSLMIETQVREDAITLFGFESAAAQEWFRLLISVQGVGAKAALSILSVCPADQLGFTIASGDKTSITRADGVGPKLATRILTELKDKAEKIGLSDIMPPPAQNGAAGTASSAMAVNMDRGKTHHQDAVSALANLGYAPGAAYAAVQKVRQENEEADLQTLIRLSLQELSAA